MAQMYCNSDLLYRFLDFELCTVMRHLPLSKWGVRAESWSRHPPVSRGGTCLPRRKPRCSVVASGSSPLLSKPFFLLMWPEPPVAQPRCWLLMEPVGGGARQPHAVLPAGPGRFAGTKEWGGGRTHCPGGCGTCQPSLLQPCVTFAARREGLSSCRHSLGADASGSVGGRWLLRGSSGVWEPSQAEQLAPCVLPQSKRGEETHL